jgi:hypothetical protein
MLVQRSLSETAAFSSHVLLARREADILGESYEPNPNSEHLLRAVLWSGEVFEFGGPSESRRLLERLDELRQIADGRAWTFAELLDAACSAAHARDDSHLGFEHVIVAWSLEPSGPVAALLDEAGLRRRLLDESKLRSHPPRL